MLANNVIYVSAGGSTLAVTGGVGTASLRTNCLPTGFRKTHESLNGSVEDTGTVAASDPEFSNLAEGDFTLAADSPCLDKAGPLSAEAQAHPVLHQIAAPTELVARSIDSVAHLGAFER